MRKLSRCDLLHAVADHDIEEVRSLLRQAESQHLSLPADFYPELPEIIRWLYLYFSRPGKAPFAERYWQVLPDAAYGILELLRPFYDFGERVKLWHNHFLYQPILHGDIRMLEYLWSLDPLKQRASQQPLGHLFRAAVEDFCYMRLPDWKGLPPDRKIHGYSLDLGAKNWLEKLYAQAELCHTAPQEHLEFLLKHGCSPDSAKVKLQLRQPHFALRMRHDGPSKTRHNWEITDRNLTHHQGQDCEGMVKACIHDGEYWILTCVCCVPGCANVRAPVLSMIFGDVARWRVTSSEDDGEPGVYYLAVPVADYLSDIDLLLAPIERGIKEAVVDDEAGPDSPIVEFSATAHSLKKVKTLRNLIRRKLSGEKIPEFKKKTGTDFHEN